MKVAYEVTIKKSGNTFAEVLEDKDAAIGYGEYKAL